LNLSN